MKCPCGGKIKSYIPDYLKDDPSYIPQYLFLHLIFCNKCGEEYTWKEYQEMRCDKLVKMMGENEI